MDEKTEKFLQELKDKGLYRDDYDYSKVVYENNHSDIIIIDEDNIAHYISPRSILNGNNLSFKSIINKNNYIIQKSMNLYNNKYDYSKLNYKDAKTPIIIIDENGFEHEQIAYNHINGRELSIKSCTDKTNFYINKLKYLYKNYNYDFSKVEYIDVRTPIIIIDEDGLEHKKIPDLNKSSLGIRSVIDKNSFIINKIKKIHKNYIYTELNYKEADQKIQLIDENGFSHEQLLHSILNGSKLSIKSAVNKNEYFIFISQLLHGDKYDYTKVNFNKSDKKVIIICKEHGGEFKQTPRKHLNGQGCPICNGGWTFQYKLDVINNLNENDLYTMESIELYEIISQGKIHEDFEALLSSEACSEERISSLKELKEHFENNLPVDEIIDAEIIEEEETEEELNQLNKNNNNNKNEEEKRPPVLGILKDLHTLDNPLYAGMDEEAIEFLIQYKVRKLWNNILNNNISISDIENEDGSTYYNKIKDIFVDEYYQVEKYQAPKGYNFPHNPNMMQKLMVNRLLKNKNYGNWSGTGSGKTLSFIIASREINSKLTLVVCLNSTVTEISRVIKEVYNDSEVFNEYSKDMKFDKTKNNYLVLNYEKFQQQGSEKLFQNLTDNNIIDFVVIDEVHNAKQRDEAGESERRKVLMNLLARIRENNEDLHTLMMSATPVINNLYEAKSLLEMLTGKDYSDIGIRSTIGDALGIHRQMSLNGIRFMPKYDISVREYNSSNSDNLCIDGQHLLENLVNVESNQPSTIEQILLNDKLDAIESYLKKGVIIYSYYTTGIISVIEKFVKDKGFTVGTYTGDESTEMRDENLKNFTKGKLDILIGSKPIGTGVDGLQKVCSRMICLVLPWTDAEFTQLKGRIYRQGSIFGEIDIVIPQVKINFGDENVWSWDIQRINLIKSKKTLADAAVDGHIPSKLLPSKESYTKKSIESLKNWKERLNSDNIISFEREKLKASQIEESDEVIRERLLSELSEFNQRGKITKSSTMHKEFTENKDSWFRYHKLRNMRMEEWSEIPYEYIASKIKNTNDVIVDFGCGENKFKDCVKSNKVISFDHVAFDDSVIACDMSDISEYVENESVDICVFSLSLWGVNFNDYIKEAYRVLKNKGIIYIAEPNRNYETEEELNSLSEIITNNGFLQIGSIERRNKFVYLTGIKM